ncbi:MAG: ammonia-forming cytochrome c nitrite reductase subunit c552 [Sandaracinaceae bacterium]
MPRRLAAALVLAVLAILVAVDAWRVRADLDTPRDLHGARFATSHECARCHPSEHASWSRTFHRTMTQEATEAAVVGDFADAELLYGGLTARFSRDADGAFRLDVLQGDARLAHAEIVRTVGSRRIQQYLARDGDVVYRLPVAWDLEAGRWMHMNAAFLTPDPPELDADETVSLDDFNRHVTRWNDNCVFCHNVDPQPGWDPRSERYDTAVAELGVACEACHGPADGHATANADPLRRYALHGSDDGDPSIVNPARLEPAASSAICGRCHGQRITADIDRFLQDGDPFVPGDDLAAYSRPLARDTALDGDATFFAARFWPDGTARLTAYEYQGLRQSPCTDLGCLECHGMHEGDPRGQVRDSHRADGACTGCHAVDDHAHHLSVTCVDCHMPRIVYGVVEVHRSHRIERPDPFRTDRPDACTLCHAERSRRWAQLAFRRLYGGGGSLAEDGDPEVHRLTFGGDPVERAVAAAALGRRDTLTPTRRRRRLGILLDTMTDDPYPAVRRIAERSLGSLEGRADGFDPTAPRRRRAAWAAAYRAEHDAEPPPARLLALRARAGDAVILIGE